jgi:hypothetical protein
MPNRYTDPALRLIEESYRNSYCKLLDIALDANGGPVMQLVATGEAIMLAAALGKIRRGLAITRGE